jgi:hypothetical protein
MTSRAGQASAIARASTGQAYATRNATASSVSGISDLRSHRSTLTAPSVPDSARDEGPVVEVEQHAVLVTTGP